MAQLVKMPAVDAWRLNLAVETYIKVKEEN